MQIYAYPGDRLDFISKTSSAGALEFGDPVGLVEEFFGPAHTKTPLENEALPRADLLQRFFEL